MPHIVMQGPVSVEDIWLAFKPLEIHEDGSHFKATDAYLSADRKTLLVRSLVVERSFPKSFFLRIAESGDTITLGLEAPDVPERTDAVKRYIALCAWQLLQSEPEMRIVKGNIVDLVSPPKGSA